MTVYYQDTTVTLHHGHVLDVLPTLPDESVDCAVTSPPYFGLRSYLPEGHPDKAKEIGTEKTPAEYVEKLRGLFAEVRRVLAKDGTLWLNLGDSYSSKVKGSGGTGKSTLVGTPNDGNGQLLTAPYRMDCGVPDKNILGIPWRVAFALQVDGWILRNAIVWHKPNAMPESVTDRLSTRYEMLFMFSKSRRYWFDVDPIREAHAIDPTWGRPGWNADNRKIGNGDGTTNGKGAHPTGTSADLGFHPNGRNPGDVWTVPTVPFNSSHFATFPPELPRRCIVAGCKPGGTVLDPFHGSGTTGMVATRNGRKYVGIELNKDYLDLSLRTRLADGVLDFEEPA